MSLIVCYNKLLCDNLSHTVSQILFVQVEVLFMTTYHLIGIKGTGMSALAQILCDSGETVQGSDVGKHFFTEEALLEKNIPILPFSKKY